MAFRVTISYARAAEPPGERELDRLRRDLQSAAPDAAARVALSAGALDVALTIDSDRDVDAVTQAVRVAGAVVGDASIRASAQPIPLPGVNDA